MPRKQIVIPLRGVSQATALHRKRINTDLFDIFLGDLRQFAFISGSKSRLNFNPQPNT